MEPVPYMSYKRKLTCPLNSVTKLNDKKLKICCITYNMHGENPTQQEVAQFLNPHKNYDIYAIGSEECLRSIFKSLFWSDKSSWENKLSNYFGNEYLSYYNNLTGENATTSEGLRNYVGQVADSISSPISSTVCDI